MLCLDTNILVHAFRTGSPEHQRVHSWLIDALSGDEPVIVPVEVGSAFLRLCTNRRALPDASSSADALEFLHRVTSAAYVVSATPSAWQRFVDLVAQFELVGNDIPDALIAAQAMDYQAELVSFDQGFERFTDLAVRPIPPVNSEG